MRDEGRLSAEFRVPSSEFRVPKTGSNHDPRSAIRALPGASTHDPQRVAAIRDRRAPRSRTGRTASRIPITFSSAVRLLSSGLPCGESVR